MKGLMEIHNPGKCDLHSICRSQVLYISKVSRTCKKGHFGLLLGGFWYITTPNQVQIVPNFHQQCNAIQSIKYVMVFNIILKIRKIDPKNPFFGIFSKVFRPRPLNELMPRPNLLSNERSYEETQSCQVSSS